MRPLLLFDLRRPRLEFFLKRLCSRRLSFISPDKIVEQPKADIEQHAACEQFKGFRVRKIKHPQVIPDEDAGKRSRDHYPGDRPGHASFLDITIHAAWNSYDIVNMIGPAYRRSRVVQRGHLERQEQEGAGDRK